MPKVWECNRCGHKFTRSAHLENHKKVCGKLKQRQEQNQFKCDCCKKTFGLKRNLTSHLKACQGPPPPPQSFQCEHCGETFQERYKAKRHAATCKQRPNDVIHQRAAQSPFLCDQCGKMFRQMQGLRRHLPKCRKPQTFDCDYCEKAFEHRQNMERHQVRCQARPSPASCEPQRKMLTCRQCGEQFQGFRALRHHQLDVHVGRGIVLHPEPDWLATASEELQSAYRLHRGVILGPHDLSQELIHQYNFPTPANDFSPDVLEEQIRFIYGSEGKSFRVNIAAGLLLQNVETGEFRYFHPHRNVWLFDRPVMVQNVRDLEKLIEILRNLDLEERVKVDRPDTKWHLVAVVNLRYTVFLTSFALGCPDVRLPRHILAHRFIKTLLHDRSGNGMPFDDNLCFFRALSESQECEDVERSTQEYCDQWMQYKGLDGEFAGVETDDFPELEDLFSVNINVLSLDENGEVHGLYSSTRHFQTDLYLNADDSHLSLITDIQKYSKKFVCDECNTPFNRIDNFKRHAHQCKGEDSTRLIYPGGFHKPYSSIFDRVESWGIKVEQKPDTYFVTYDFECILEKVPQPDVELKTRWLARHLPVSVSIASNVPGFEAPRCIVEPDLDVLLSEMMAYLEEVREQAELANDLTMSDVLTDLESKAEEFREKADAQQQQQQPIGVPGATDITLEYEKLAEEVEALAKQLRSYTRTLCVLGFNSQRYDLCLIQNKLAELLELDQENGFVIRKQNQYSCISAKGFRFLDISNYLAPHTSYDAFLKAYKCSVHKSHFPYEWFDSENKLDHPELPEYDSFKSSLKGGNTLEMEYRAYEKLIAGGISQEEALKKLRLSDVPLTGAEHYQQLLDLWEREGMETVQDLLIYYNNRDVVPFVEAVEKMIKVYENRGINMLRDAISVPGISRISLFKAARELNVSFPIFGPEDDELHTLFKTNVTGGPAIIHRRHHETDKTYIRNNKDHPFRGVIGFDANNLYGWALSQPLCCGTYIVRHEDDAYYPHKREKYSIAYHWLDWIADTEQIEIDHKMNSGKEHRVGGYFVDGFNADRQTVWEFHGCWWHACDCVMPDPGVNDELRGELERRRARTVARTQILRDHGLTVIEKWECEFRAEMKTDPTLKAFVASRQPAFFQQTGTRPQTLETLLDGVKSGVLYGFLECDIHVPEQWEGDFKRAETPEEFFSEFPPLFCTTDIPFSCIGDHMQKYVKEQQLQAHLDAGLPRDEFSFKEPASRRLLVSGTRAERILLHTDLLSWYLEHGLKVTRVYKVIEFQSSSCFRPFIDEMTNLRRQADKDPDQGIIADTAKLLCNSSYGSLLMNKERHQDVKYVRGKEQATRHVKHTRFKSMTAMSDDLYELHMQKQTINLDLPIYLGVQILQLAKLSLLRYYYGFLRQCCSYEKWELCHEDTDSMYIAHDGKESWEEIIHPDFRDEYRNQIGRDNCNDLDLDSNKFFFPRSCCGKHIDLDKRHPGLYKKEFQSQQQQQGEGKVCYIGLASKTYWISSPKSEKFTSKGLQKNRVQNVGERFMRVLSTGNPEGARNFGFRSHEGTIFTYSQYRKGLPYFYCKREVLEDGVSTKPLKITLNPWK